MREKWFVQLTCRALRALRQSLALLESDDATLALAPNATPRIWNAQLFMYLNSLFVCSSALFA